MAAAARDARRAPSGHRGSGGTRPSQRRPPPPRPRRPAHVSVDRGHRRPRSTTCLTDSRSGRTAERELSVILTGCEEIAETRICVILSEVGRVGVKRRIKSGAKSNWLERHAQHRIVTPGGARAKHGALSWRTKRLLFASGLILRFTLTHPSSLPRNSQCLCGFWHLQT